MLEAGANPIIVAAQMGHSSMRMTEHYAHVSDQAQLKAVKTLEKQASSAEAVPEG
jgi:integrase